MNLVRTIYSKTRVFFLFWSLSEVQPKVSHVFHLWRFQLVTLLLLFGETDAYEREIIRLQALDDEVPTPNVSEASESEGESAQDILSDHDTDTEHAEMLLVQPPDFCIFTEETKWKKHAPRQRVRTRQQTIVTQLPCVPAGAKYPNMRRTCVLDAVY